MDRISDFLKDLKKRIGIFFYRCKYDLKYAFRAFTEEYKDIPFDMDTEILVLEFIQDLEKDSMLQGKVLFYLLTHNKSIAYDYSLINLTHPVGSVIPKMFCSRSCLREILDPLLSVTRPSYNTIIYLKKYLLLKLVDKNSVEVVTNYVTENENLWITHELETRLMGISRENIQSVVYDLFKNNCIEFSERGTNEISKDSQRT